MRVNPSIARISARVITLVLVALFIVPVLLSAGLYSVRKNGGRPTNVTKALAPLRDGLLRVEAELQTNKEAAANRTI